MSYMLQPQILVLRDGTENSQGKEQIITNINACMNLVDLVRTTLGPRGMDKMIVSDDRSSSTISNDGATIIKLLEVVHPAAKSLADVAKSQDNEVGDGTTSVTILTGELLKEAKNFIEDGMHSQVIISGFWKAYFFAREKLHSLSKKIDETSSEEKRNMLLYCAQTALNSKLISNYKEFFSKMVVDAVEKLEDYMDKSLIGIKHITGGSVHDSFLVDGVAFKKTFSYAGFEQQPKKFEDPKIVVLNVELELKAERENAEVRIENPDDYQSIIDAEWKIINGKLEAIKELKAQVVLSKQPIGDLATQYFAQHGIFCAGRVPEEDLKRVCKATGAKLQHTCNGLKTDILGTCGKFEEVQIGAERFNLFSESKKSKTATIIIRGGAQQFIDEAERSLNDAIMIVKRAMKATSVVAGGGAIEMELSKQIRDYAKNLNGKEQTVVMAFARALEVIPRQLAQNSGYDAVDIINKLRQKHNTSTEFANFGVDCFNGGIFDAMTNYVWEPTMLKSNVLAAATEASCIILSVDQTVRNPKNEQAQQEERKIKASKGRGGLPGFRTGQGAPVMRK
jgi:T-complex protein 1 subunit eta